jgi:hypothetical protein
MRIKKNLIFYFIFVSFLFSENENLVKNYSFEEGTPNYGVAFILPGWAVRDFADVVYYHSIDNEVSHTGKRSARIKIDKNEKSGYFTPYPKIEVKPSKKYIIEFWAKTDVTDGKAGVGISLLDKNMKFMGMSTVKNFELPQKSDWQNYKVEYFTPQKEENMFLNVTFGLEGVGTVWYDDISIYEKGEKEDLIIDFYPSSINTKNAIFPVKKEISYIIFHFFSDMKFKDFKIQIKTPSLFPLISTSSNYGKNEFKEMKEEGNYKYYEIYVNPEIVKPTRLIENDLWFGVNLIFDTSENIKEDKIEWKIIGNGKEIKSGIFKIEPVEKLEGIKLPKNFKIYSWWFHPLINKDVDYEVFQKIIELYDKVGIKGGEIPLDRKKYEFLKNKKWEVIDYFWYPVNKCPFEFIESKEIEKIIDSSINSYLNPDWIIWNYEPNINNFQHFCDRCRKEFIKFTGIDLKETDFNQVYSKYPEEFLKFAIFRQDEIVKKFSEEVRKNGIKCGISSYSLRKFENQEDYKKFISITGGLDVEKIYKYIDGYSTQIYQKPNIFWNFLKIHKEKLPIEKLFITVTTSERHNLSDFPYSLTSPEELYIEIISSAVLGFKKMIFFVGAYTLDGKQIKAIEKAMKEISTFKEFFEKGEIKDKIFEIDNPSVKGVLYHLKNKYLLCLFNLSSYSKCKIPFKFNAPFENFIISEPLKNIVYSYENGKILWNREKSERIKIELIPLESKFILIESGISKKSGKKFEIDLREEKETKEMRIIDDKIWKCELKKDEFLQELVVKNPIYEISIYPEKGAVIGSFKINHKETVNFSPEQQTSGLFRDLFWEPKEARWSGEEDANYEFKEYKVEDKKLFLKFERKIEFESLKGLIIGKTYILEQEIPKINVKYEIRNEMNNTINFAFWAHSQPFFLSKDVEISIPLYKKKLILNKGTAKEYNYFIPVKDIASNEVSYSFLGFDKNTLNFVFEKDKTSMVYIWFGERPTVEFIYNKIELKPKDVWKTEIEIIVK